MAPPTKKSLVLGIKKILFYPIEIETGHTRNQEKTTENCQKTSKTTPGTRKNSQKVHPVGYVFARSAVREVYP